LQEPKENANVQIEKNKNLENWWKENEIKFEKVTCAKIILETK